MTNQEKKPESESTSQTQANKPFFSNSQPQNQTQQPQSQS